MKKIAKKALNSVAGQHLWHVVDNKCEQSALKAIYRIHAPDNDVITAAIKGDFAAAKEMEHVGET